MENVKHLIRSTFFFFFNEPSFVWGHLFVLIFIIYLFLAASGLSCGMQDLHCGMWDFSLQHVGSSLQHTGFSLIVACGLL